MTRAVTSVYADNSQENQRGEEILESHGLHEKLINYLQTSFSSQAFF